MPKSNQIQAAEDLKPIHDRKPIHIEGYGLGISDDRRPIHNEEDSGY